MVEIELVMGVRAAVEELQKRYGVIDMVFFFRNAYPDEDSTGYSPARSYPWKLLVAAPWVSVTGTKEPVTYLATELKRHLGERERDLHLVQIVTPEASIIRAIKAQIPENQIEADLRGINLPNILIVEGKAFKI